MTVVELRPKVVRVRSTVAPAGLGAVSASQPDDRALLAAIAADLNAGFEELVKAYQRPIFSGLLRMTGNWATAEDLAQDAFVRVYRALGDYSHDRIQALQLRGWVWTVALNVARNHARAKSRRPHTQPLDRQDPAGSQRVDDEALEPLINAEWQTRLNGLKPEWREAVVLRHVVGLSYSEIAEAVGRPEATLRSHVHRGLEALAAALGSERSRA